MSKLIGNPQRWAGLALLFFPCLMLLICRGGDATALLLTIPLGAWMVFGKTELFSLNSGNEMRRSNMDYRIKYVRGHYEVYLGSRFICSGDTKDECMEAIDEMSADAA